VRPNAASVVAMEVWWVRPDARAPTLRFSAIDRVTEDLHPLERSDQTCSGAPLNGPSIDVVVT